MRGLKRDGVQVKILTGDNELVTRHVCAEVGLDAERIVLGDEVERMTDAALGHVAEHVALEIQGVAGSEVTFGRTRSTGVKGQYNLVYEYHQRDVGIEAGRLAR